jgi:CheY-like chemotaxis protein
VGFLRLVKKTILYVDDNKDDAVIVERALNKDMVPAKLFTVHDGCNAVDWLTANGVDSDRKTFPAPDLLIVDLDFPTESGFDLMEFVQARRDLKKLPIIVYTGSDRAEDKARAFNLGANAYVCKASGTNDLVTYVRSVVTSLPELPRR